MTSDEDSSLEHASDLGRWLVRWGTTTLGGDVSLVGDGDARGPEDPSAGAPPGGTTIDILSALKGEDSHGTAPLVWDVYGL